MKTEQVTGTLKDVARKLESLGYKTLKGKGGFFVKGHGHWTNAKARRVTGIKSPEKKRQARISAYGDYATIAAINGQLNK